MDRSAPSVSISRPSTPDSRVPETRSASAGITVLPETKAQRSSPPAARTLVPGSCISVAPMSMSKGRPLCTRSAATGSALGMLPPPAALRSTSRLDTSVAPTETPMSKPMRPRLSAGIRPR